MIHFFTGWILGFLTGILVLIGIAMRSMIKTYDDFYNGKGGEK